MRFPWPYVMFLAICVVVLVMSFPWRRGAHAADAPAGSLAAGGLKPATTIPANAQQATFAAGCFWGVEEGFKRLPGMVATQVGYTGGKTENPTYQEVCTGITNHAEAVLVTFDPAKISYAELLDAFWTAHDPTTKNRQGPDVGTQYRSAVFFHNADQEKTAKESLKEVDAGKFFKEKIVTEVTAATKFYPAEDYHQLYIAKTGGVCHLGPATVRTTLAKTAAAARSAATAPANKP